VDELKDKLKDSKEGSFNSKSVDINEEKDVD